MHSLAGLMRSANPSWFFTYSFRSTMAARYSSRRGPAAVSSFLCRCSFSRHSMSWTMNPKSARAWSSPSAPLRSWHRTRRAQVLCCVQRVQTCRHNAESWGTALCRLHVISKTAKEWKTNFSMRSKAALRVAHWSISLWAQWFSWHIASSASIVRCARSAATSSTTLFSEGRNAPGANRFTSQVGLHYLF